jgi:hypothetical protein
MSLGRYHIPVAAVANGRIEQARAIRVVNLPSQYKQLSATTAPSTTASLQRKTAQ